MKGTKVSSISGKIIAGTEEKFTQNPVLGSGSFWKFKNLAGRCVRGIWLLVLILAMATDIQGKCTRGGMSANKTAFAVGQDQAISVARPMLDIILVGVVNTANSVELDIRILAQGGEGHARLGILGTQFITGGHRKNWGSLVDVLFTTVLCYEGDIINKRFSRFFIWNKLEDCPIGENIFCLRISNILDPRLHFAGMHRSFFIVAREWFEKLKRSDENHKGAVILVVLSHLIKEGTDSNQYQAYGCPGQNSVGIKFLTPPFFRNVLLSTWGRTFLGGLLFLFGGGLIGFALVFFASHDVTLLALLKLVVLDIVGFGVLWCSFSLLFP